MILSALLTDYWGLFG